MIHIKLSMLVTRLRPRHNLYHSLIVHYLKFLRKFLSGHFSAEGGFVYHYGNRLFSVDIEPVVRENAVGSFQAETNAFGVILGTECQGEFILAF